MRSRLGARQAAHRPPGWRGRRAQARQGRRSRRFPVRGGAASSRIVEVAGSDQLVPLGPQRGQGLLAGDLAAAHPADDVVGPPWPRTPRRPSLGLHLGPVRRRAFSIWRSMSASRGRDVDEPPSRGMTIVAPAAHQPLFFGLGIPTGDQLETARGRPAPGSAPRGLPRALPCPGVGRHDEHGDLLRRRQPCCSERKPADGRHDLDHPPPWRRRRSRRPPSGRPPASGRVISRPSPPRRFPQLLAHETAPPGAATGGWRSARPASTRLGPAPRLAPPSLRGSLASSRYQSQKLVPEEGLQLLDRPWANS